MAIRVFIDQGHNPQNPNAGAEGNGYREQDIVYRVGVALNSLLTADPNFVSRLSRPTPDTVLGVTNTDSLRLRVAGAVAFGADLFLSIHTNAAASPLVGGSEALVFSATSPAYRIAEVLLLNLTEAVGFQNRGVKLRPGLYISRVDGDATTFDLRTRTPNAGDYMSNLVMHSVEHLFATAVRNGGFGSTSKK